MVAREAALREVANSRLRRLSAHSKLFNCTDVAIGDSVLSHKAANRRSTPRWSEPANISDINETRVRANFQSRTFHAAGYDVGKKTE